MSTVTEDEVIKAIEYIKKEAKNFAATKAKRVTMDDYLKVVKSEQINKSESSSMGQKESDAYASQEYKDALKARSLALEEETRMQWYYQAALATIDVWKTLEYTKRAEIKNLM